jgi:hypothetical protein
MRLRQVLADSFSREARLQHVSNTAIAAVLDVLLVGTVLKSGGSSAAQAEATAAEARTAVAEATATPVEAARLAVAGLEARLSAEGLAALEARLAEEEALATAARHPQRLEALARHRPSPSQPPSGVEADHPRWTSYVAYWHRRYEEMAGTRPLPPRVLEAKPPLTWESYSTLLGRFQRSLEFQHDVTRRLQQPGSAAGSQEWLPGMKQPLITSNTGLQLEGRAAPVYVDQLAVDQATLGPGLRPSVHTFSNKQRNFTAMSPDEALRQYKADLQEVHAKYSGIVEVRRPGHPLFQQKVEISQAHIVYDGGLVPIPIRNELSRYARSRGAVLHFHDP